MQNPVSRMPWVDALKGLACLLIVSHHLAFYGPMSDIAYPLMPGLINGLYNDGRIAVQIFFVTAGFLLAGKFAPTGMVLASAPITALKQRYLRLVLPYLAALTLAIVSAALAGGWMIHDSIPAEPNIGQLVAHVFLLQGLLDQEALSAGVWYVAIDFQLFAVAMLLLWLSRRIVCNYPRLQAAGPILVAVLTLASLFIFNRNDAWDDTALYFFGAYGLGILAYQGSNRRHGNAWLALLTLLVLAALLLEFRSRIALAGGVMLLLGLGRQYGVLERWAAPRFLTYLGRISYSIFLVHFPLCLLVNAAFFHFFPQQALINLFGMVLALALSIAAGALFFRQVESRRLSNRTGLMLSAGFMASGLLSGL
ncbi:MAG: acyltransferase [Oxalobacteraceae bacterium]|nr:acyltransferase [Oxalobacteraceae bacterium]